MLDLAVPPPEKHQLAPVVVRAQIARAVHELRNLRAQRIGHKGGGGLFRRVVVARRQARAAHADFPVDEHDARVGAGEADGQAVRVRKGAIHPVPRAHVGDLSGPVHIHVVSIGQGKAPPVQRGAGHDLAAEEHPPQCRKATRCKHIRPRQRCQRRGHPENRINALARQPLHKPRREQKVHPGNQMQAAPHTHDAVDVQHGIVEVEGRLRAKTRALGKPKRIARPLHQINHAAMGDGHALGHAGGAAGEQHIEQVGIDVRGPALLEQRSVHLAGDGIVAAQKGVSGHAAGQLGIALLVHDGGGTQGVCNQPDPRRGHGGVQRRVEAPSAHRAQHGAQAIRALVHENQHRLLHIHLRGKEAACFLGCLPNLFPGHSLVGRVNGNTSGSKPGCLLQPVQHIPHAHGCRYRRTRASIPSALLKLSGSISPAGI